MATLNEVSAFVCERLGQGLNSVLQEQMKFAIKNVRSQFIRQDAEKNGTNPSYIQRFITELVKVDIADSCAVTVGCPLLRTSAKIPKPVRIKGDAPFRFVGDVTGNVWTYVVGIDELKYVLFNKYTSKVTRYVYVNGYIYVYEPYTDNPKIKYITIEAPFANPIEAIDLCIGSANCVTDDDAFPVDEDMLNAIITEVLRLNAPLSRSTDTEVKINDEAGRN